MKTTLKQFLLEVIEPKAPSEGVKISKIEWGAGWRYAWTTKLGNLVEVYFMPRHYTDDVEYVAIFEVNGDEDAVPFAAIDREILPGVLHLIMSKVDELGIDVLNFEALSSHSDTKNVHVHDVDKLIKVTDERLLQLIDSVERYKPEGVGDDTVDTLTTNDKMAMLTELKNLITHIREHAREVHKWHPPHRTLSKLEKLGFQVKPIMTGLDKIQAVNDNGYAKITKNRRDGIYLRLVKKYLPSGWTFKHVGNNFKLTRNVRNENNL